MTDEIIIDGVDVSGCGYYDSYMSNGDCIIQGLGTNNSILCCNCKDNTNCYYKQRQRKEQECARYKQVLEKIKETATDLKTRKDYHSLDEVIADIDKILTIVNEVENEHL